MTSKLRLMAVAVAAVFAAACGQYAGVHEEAYNYAPAGAEGGAVVEVPRSAPQVGGNTGVNRDGAEEGLHTAQVKGNSATSLEGVGQLVQNLPKLHTVRKDSRAEENGAGDDKSGGDSARSSTQKDGQKAGGDRETRTKGSGKDKDGSSSAGDKSSDKSSGDDDETLGTSGGDDTSEDPAGSETADQGGSETTDDTSTTEGPDTSSPQDLQDTADYVDSITLEYARHNVTVLPADFPFVICPVQGEYGYSPGFGDLRCVSDAAWCGGFHYHQGVDIFADEGTPIVAPFDGYVEDATNYVGGTAVRVRGAYGYVYNAHLIAIRRDVVGQTVPAGTVVGWVGNTGDARGTMHHDHFEWHPGDGDAIDPFPYLYVVCPPS